MANKTKGRISKRVLRENKARQIFRKTNMRIRGVRNVRFSENLACFVFLKHPFWDSPFCLITDEISSSVFINPFHTTGVFPYLLKISEYVRGSPDIFGEYMMRPVFWNKLNEDKSQILNTSLASESNKTNARRKE